MIGRTLKGTYRISELVGTGGFADVYLGRDVRSNTVVAIKVLHPHFARDPQFVKRFLQEAHIAQALSEPHIVRVLDVGQDSDLYFIVMEYVQGHTLANILKVRGYLPVHEAIDYACQILLALDAAHGTQVIHRDIKPQNIMVTPGGTVKVMDFGIAKQAAAGKMTHTGMYLGTPQYMSPEQSRGDKVDARSDLYSVAVVLYEMLGGRPPFDGEGPWSVLNQQVTAEPPPLSMLRAGLSAGLIHVVSRGLEKSVSGRFQSAKGMAEALRAVLPEAWLQDQARSGRSAFPEPPHKAASLQSAAPLLGLGVIALALLVFALGSLGAAPTASGTPPGTASSEASDAEAVDLPANPTAIVLAVTPSPVATATGAPAASPSPIPRVSDEIAYVSPSGDLWVARTDGTNARKVAAGPVARPAWSHDGRQIAYLRVSESGTTSSGQPYFLAAQIEVVSADGPKYAVVVPPKPSPLQSQAFPNVEFRRVKWAPDDTAILFQYALGNISGKGIIRRDLATGKEQDLRVFAFDFDVAPDGSVVYYNVSDYSPAIGRVTPDGQNQRLAVNLATVGTPVVSPDGGKIVVGGSVIDREGTRILNVLQFKADSIAWSADGNSLVYGQGGSLWLVPAAGGTPAKMFSGSDPAWRPTH